MAGLPLTVISEAPGWVFGRFSSTDQVPLPWWPVGVSALSLEEKPGFLRSVGGSEKRPAPSGKEGGERVVAESSWGLSGEVR